MPNATNWPQLKRFAEQQRDRCARRLCDAMRLAQDAQKKLALLAGYRDDYLHRMGSASRDGIHSERLRVYRTFIANLERAVEQQDRAVAAARRDVELAQAAWAAQQRTVDSYQALAERQEAALAVRERREQQKQQDEFATRALPRFLTGAD